MTTVKFQLRRDTAANWTSVNPVLGSGEPALETDTLLVKYGDGVTAWTALSYAAIDLPATLEAYAGGDTPSAFTLSIVDSANAGAWRTAIGAQQASTNLTSLAGVTPIADGSHTVGANTITTSGGLIVSIT